jgi:hypothetical protein
MTHPTRDEQIGTGLGVFVIVPTIVEDMAMVERSDLIEQAKELRQRAEWSEPRLSSSYGQSPDDI